MTIDISAFNKICAATCLELSSAEHPDELIEKINNTIDEAAILHKVKTDNILPLIHPLERTQRLRNDQVDESNQEAILKAVAPQFDDGLFLVPQVIHPGN